MIQLNINNNKKITKHDHDLVKGIRKLTCFCVDKLVSNSDLLCLADFYHYDAMLEAKHIVKSFQIHFEYTREEWFW